MPRVDEGSGRVDLEEIGRVRRGREVDLAEKHQARVEELRVRNVPSHGVIESCLWVLARSLDLGRAAGLTVLRAQLTDVAVEEK